ncbi:hypothetical protein FBR43_00790 [Sphingomonas baiyangensis]|uniref:Haemolysin activator HlyB C-terminal domain-containing protein n=1 Tax=Sphingomonas baiyangensis TaxID=2572576 RepID=A0A4U1L8N6_9SPHN|nr:hypothetical protein FBR43_00790 [Sphingomonas baiyangensis]
MPGQQRTARNARFSGSAWVALRGGSGRAIADGGQLGGSQAGVRIGYLLDARRRLSATARISAPLEGIGREAAIGVEWRPTRAAVSIIAEQRIALDAGRGGTALFAVGGFGPQSVGHGFEVEGYAQAGGVLRDRIEPFADGALRIARPIAATPIGALSLGAGLWGGAQRGAARLDIGPSLGLAMPAGDRTIRVALDWRQRVAGRARPGSGVALTLGTDF